nr:6-phosphogluconolactonase-like [Nerophis lumbriciformis]
MSEQPSLGRGPCMVSLDQTGGVLMVANYGSGGVASYPCAGGVIEAGISHQHIGSSVEEKRQTGPHAHSIYAGPQNQYAYAADLGTDEVVVYALEVETGKLKKQGVAQLPPGSGPRHMRLSRDGKRLYVLNELTLTVSVFLREKEGGLKLERTVSVLNEDQSKEKMTCSEILVSGDGRFIYTANRDLTKEGRDSVSVLSVNGEGELKLLQVAKVGVWIPRHINLSPSGGWLLVAGQVSNEVAFLKVKEDGLLESTEKKIALRKAMCICF